MTPEITYIVSAEQRPVALALMLGSLVLQTHEEWEAIVTDIAFNPVIANKHELVCSIDTRIRYLRSGAENLYGAAEEGVAAATGEWLCFPSDDGYYCPWFGERMLKAARDNDWDMVYCDIVMGGAQCHRVLGAKPSRCNIDKTNFMVRRDWFDAFDSKLTDYQQSDGIFVEKLVGRGIRHGRLAEVLCVHN